MKTAYTYDDIQIIPNYSEVKSRSDCSLKTRITRNYSMDIPIVSSPMDTVTEHEMAYALHKLGGFGCIHRFMSIADQVEQVNNVHRHKMEDTTYPFNEVIAYPKCIAAIGATGDYQERAKELIAAGARILLIDVAHGSTIQMKEALTWCKSNLPSYVDIIAGNVATYDGACRLADWGADAIRVGIGNGALCETRIRTGIGVPQVTAIMDVMDALIESNTDIPIIADGGIRTAGDVAKALSLGADSVMLGSLLAGTRESPGEIQRMGKWPNEELFKKYRGSASAEAKIASGQEAKNVEGNSKLIPYKGKVERIINDICDGVKSAMSYTNSTSILQFYTNSDHIVVTQNGLIEAQPHLLL